MLQHYEVQYNWQGNKFPLAIQKIGKFEKKNSGAIANVEWYIHISQIRA